MDSRRQTLKPASVSSSAALPGATAGQVGTAASSARPTASKRRWQPWGAGIAQSIGLLNLLTMVALLYGIGEYMSRPLHHARGAEVTLDVLRVIDGDTFIATAYPDKLNARFRLRRIDAPELTQPYGLESKAALEALLGVGVPERRGAEHRRARANPTRDGAVADIDALHDITAPTTSSFKNGVDVTALVHDVDDAGRYVVDVVIRRGLSTRIDYVQERMVADGWAWAFQTFAGKGPLGEFADAAKAARKGLWQDDQEPVAPWRFRQRAKAAADGPKTAGGRHKEAAPAAAAGGNAVGDDAGLRRRRQSPSTGSHEGR